MKVVSRAFSARDLVGGHPVLNLVNTVTARNTDTPIDWLDGYPRLVEWAGLAGIAEPKILAAVGLEAAASSKESRGALMRLREFREAMYSAYAALIAGKRISLSGLSTIQNVWHEAQARADLESKAGGVRALHSLERSGLDLVRDVLAAPAVELLLRLPMDRARVCPGEHCGWLFIDSSKGAQRIWCDMAVCGNAAKARRYLQTHRRRGPMTPRKPRSD